MRKESVVLGAISAALLAGCGSPGNGDDATGTQLLDPSRVAALLSPEAKAVVQSYESDVRQGIAAYKTQYGRLPQNLTDMPSAAAFRETAVDLIADGLAEHVPFASRETLERAATAFVDTSERQMLDRMKAQDAPNP